MIRRAVPIWLFLDIATTQGWLDGKRYAKQNSHPTVTIEEFEVKHFVFRSVDPP